MGFQTGVAGLFKKTALLRSHDHEPMFPLSHPERFGEDADTLTAPRDRGFGMNDGAWRLQNFP
jgi:hypothetical protein